MKVAKNIIGSIIGTLGLMGVFLCGGAESIAMCAMIGGIGLALLMIGGGMLAEHEEGEDEE
jgi:hypothetical protein